MTVHCIAPIKQTMRYYSCAFLLISDFSENAEISSSIGLAIRSHDACWFESTVSRYELKLFAKMDDVQGCVTPLIVPFFNGFCDIFGMR